MSAEELESKFRLLSVGFAAENKPMGTWKLMVTMKESSTTLDGGVDTSGVVQPIQGIDASGNVYADSLPTAKVIEAEWHGIGESNRRTAPDVREGEEVMIYTYGDSGQHYWTSRNAAKNGSDLRTLETVLWAFAAEDATDRPLTGDNTYYLELSTHKKLVTFSTSDKNGEVTRYTVQFDPGQGVFLIKDDHDQEFMFQSVEGVIRMINSGDVMVELTKKDLNVVVPGNHTEKTEGNLTINVTGNVKVSANGSATVEAKGSATLKAGGNATVQGAKVSLVAGETTVSGNLSVAGGLVVAGAASFPGGHGPH